MPSDYVIAVNKPIGMTPLAALDNLRLKMPELADVKLGYAGRLDPMADGLLLVLVGEANLKRKQYERLAKKYSFDFVCGFSTDTYDMLGIAEPGSIRTQSEILTAVHRAISQYVGTFSQDYPPYSAVRIHGKSLFAWARLGKLPEPLPSKTVTIQKFTVDTVTPIAAENLLSRIIDTVGLVRGDFRQEQIITRWKHLLEDSRKPYTLVSCTVNCSSGVYIRSLVHALGKKIHTGAFATRISRNRIGTYTLQSALNI